MQLRKKKQHKVFCVEMNTILFYKINLLKILKKRLHFFKVTYLFKKEMIRDNYTLQFNWRLLTLYISTRDFHF